VGYPSRLENSLAADPNNIDVWPNREITAEFPYVSPVLSSREVGLVMFAT